MKNYYEILDNCDKELDNCYLEYKDNLEKLQEKHENELEKLDKKYNEDADNIKKKHAKNIDNSFFCNLAKATIEDLYKINYGFHNYLPSRFDYKKYLQLICTNFITLFHDKFENILNKDKLLCFRIDDYEYNKSKYDKDFHSITVKLGLSTLPDYSYLSTPTDKYIINISVLPKNRSITRIEIEIITDNRVKEILYHDIYQNNKPEVVIKDIVIIE